MKQTQNPNPVPTQGTVPVQGTAPTREILPMRVSVKIHSLQTSGPTLANASVNLNGYYAMLCMA